MTMRNFVGLEKSNTEVRISYYSLIDRGKTISRTDFYGDFVHSILSYSNILEALKESRFLLITYFRQVRQAMLDFAYHLTIGNLDEAFKAIKLIKR